MGARGGCLKVRNHPGRRKYSGSTAVWMLQSVFLVVAGVVVGDWRIIALGAVGIAGTVGFFISNERNSK